MRDIRSSEVAEWCNGRLFGPDIQLSRSWKSDSRDIAPGDAFVAIKGAKTDGHLYVHQAIERGAQLLLVDISNMGGLLLDRAEFAGVTAIAVSDTTSALAKIAQIYLRELAPQVIGITGSVGKTTTRELMVSLLRRKFKTHCAIRSFNTIIGCSLTILAMPRDTEILILELGTNHFGEIHEMVSLFPADIAVITEVAPAHLEGFGNIEGVLRAKLEICEPEKLKHLIFNADNDLLREALSCKFSNISKIGVGYRGDAKLKITDTKISLDRSGAAIKAEYSYLNKSITFEAPLFGMQHAYNIGYAYAVGHHFGVSDDEIKAAFAEFSPIAGRGICKKLQNNNWVIDEAYNANPSSMSAAIENILILAGSQHFKLLAVLGGMRELGESSVFWHKKIFDMTEKFEKVVLFGEEWYDPSLKLRANTERYKEFEDITNLFSTQEMSDSVILIKGSNSYGLKRLVALLTEGSNVY